MSMHENLSSTTFIEILHAHCFFPCFHICGTWRCYTVHVKESLGLNVVHNCGGFTGTGAVGATSSVRSLDSRP